MLIHTRNAYHVLKSQRNLGHISFLGSCSEYLFRVILKLFPGRNKPSIEVPHGYGNYDRR